MQWQNPATQEIVCGVFSGIVWDRKMQLRRSRLRSSMLPRLLLGYVLLVAASLL
jgi:hypothetical protein